MPMDFDASTAPRPVIADYMSADELAAEIGRSTKTLARWDRMRVGPPRVKIGNAIFYRREAVTAWLKAQESATLRGSAA